MTCKRKSGPCWSGTTTGGGADPGDTERLDDHFLMFVPSGRPINPVTKTDWEGTGVKPDVAVPAGEALQSPRAGDRKTAEEVKDAKARERLDADVEQSTNSRRSGLHRNPVTSNCGPATVRIVRRTAECNVRGRVQCASAPLLAAD